MGRLPKIVFVWLVIIFMPCSCLSFEDETIDTSKIPFLYDENILKENTADNPRLVNLSPQQYKALEMMEKRLYKRTFDYENNIDRIERLEIRFFDEPQKGTISVRLNALKLESSRNAISGTAMTPMMQETFNRKYIRPINPDTSHYNEVGIIDGFLRLWFPELYKEVQEYRKYKEANFF